MFDGGGSTTVSRCTFTDCYNTAQEPSTDEKIGGGAIYVRNVKLICQNKCTFTSCRTNLGQGGAICAAEGSEVSLNNCDFYTCRTLNPFQGSMDDGAIFVTDRKITAVESTFSACSNGELAVGTTVRWSGGAIKSHIECRECTFTNCLSTGGAISLFEGGKHLSLKLEQCKFLECQGRNTRSAAVIYEGDGVVILRIVSQQAAGIPEH